MLDALRAGVLGVTVGVAASLLTVGLCHYLCVAFGVAGCPSIERAQMNALDGECGSGRERGAYWDGLFRWHIGH